MCATSAGSCDAGASGGEFRGALRLEEPGNLFTSIIADVTSKCMTLRTNKVRDGTSRGKFLCPVPCTHLVSEGVFECTPRNPLQQPILLWHSSDERGLRVSPLALAASGAQLRPAIEQVGSVTNRSANSSRPRAFFFFLCPWVIFWTRPHGVCMGLAWGWHGVGMGPHGVGMGLAWG
jgi:hypothetical protein